MIRFVFLPLQWLEEFMTYMKKWEDSDSVSDSKEFDDKEKLKMLLARDTYWDHCYRLVNSRNNTSLI